MINRKCVQYPGMWCNCTVCPHRQINDSDCGYDSRADYLADKKREVKDADKNK
nr:MAG: hypothetical protein [Microviridae sp.]